MNRELKMNPLLLFARIIGCLMIVTGGCQLVFETVRIIRENGLVIIKTDVMGISTSIVLFKEKKNSSIVEKQKEFQDSILNVCLDIKEMLQKNYQIVSDIQMKVTEMSEKESSSVAYDLKKKIGTILTEINVLQKQVEQIQDTLVVQEQSPMNNQGIQLFGSKLSDNIHIDINTLVEKANEMDAKVCSLQDKIDK